MPITVSLSVDSVSGTLDGVAFAGQTVTFTASGDTDAIYFVTGNPGNFAEVFNAPVTVSIPMVGNTTIPADNAFVYAGSFPYPGIWTVGINVGGATTTQLGGAFGADPSLTGYAFETPFGPAKVLGFSSLNPVQTSAGVLTLSGVSGQGAVVSVNLGNAETFGETEPNDSPATASLTYGLNVLSVSGTLDSATDQDFFSFVVTAPGGPIPPYTAAVRINIAGPPEYVFGVIGPSGGEITSAMVNGRNVIEFNPNILGLGTYTVHVGATSQSSVGPYRLLIFGVADGGGRPPLLIGSGSTSGASGGVGIPTLSGAGLLLLMCALICVAMSHFRKSIRRHGSS